MHRLGDRARYKLILSGTPVQNDAMDIFSQYRFLDPTISGQNYYTFRNRYAVMGGFNKKQVVGYRDMDELIRKEHSIAYHVTKEEAVDLPKQTFENRTVTLDKKERDVYNQLKRDSEAVLDTFKLANPYEGMDPELLEELEDELSDLDDSSGIECRRIKMPSGGALAFEVQGEDENDVDYVKEIQGVIIYTHRVNGYWSRALGDGEGGAAPVCSSMDGKTGINTTTGECISCDTCPLNQYGSDPKDGAGKACKNMRRIYLMGSGDPNCYLLTVPPTSIKDVNKKLRLMIYEKYPELKYKYRNRE